LAPEAVLSSVSTRSASASGERPAAQKPIMAHSAMKWRVLASRPAVRGCALECGAARRAREQGGSEADHGTRPATKRVRVADPRRCALVRPAGRSWHRVLARGGHGRGRAARARGRGPKGPMSLLNKATQKRGAPNKGAGGGHTSQLPHFQSCSPRLTFCINAVRHDKRGMDLKLFWFSEHERGQLCLVELACPEHTRAQRGALPRFCPAR
jgi:hypothetical protein